MWWKEGCYSRFIIMFLNISVCFTSFTQSKFGFSVEKVNSKFHSIDQLPGQSEVLDPENLKSYFRL